MDEDFAMRYGYAWAMADDQLKYAVTAISLDTEEACHEMMERLEAYHANRRRSE